MKLFSRKAVFIIFLLFALIILLAVVPYTFDKKKGLSYQKIPFHHQSYTGDENKQLYTATFDEMVILLDKETLQEKGKGILTYEFTNGEKTEAIITIEQTYTGDDSVGPSKYYIFVEKQDKGWTVVEYGVDINCTRGKSADGICL